MSKGPTWGASVELSPSRRSRHVRSATWSADSLSSRIAETARASGRNSRGFSGAGAAPEQRVARGLRVGLGL